MCVDHSCVDYMCGDNMCGVDHMRCCLYMVDLMHIVYMHKKLNFTTMVDYIPMNG